MHPVSIARHRLVRLLSLALLVTISFTFVAPPARAQTPPSASQLADAKRFFEAGLTLKRDGLYKEALASFLEADRRAPRESIQNNIALTYRLMKDMASAYDAYQLLLSKYGDTMKPRLEGEAQRAIEALGVLTGSVAVNVREPGARVVIDGKDLGLTPLAKPVRLNIGTHQVSITKDDFDPLVAPVEESTEHDTVAVDGPLVKTVATGHVAIDVKQTTPLDPTVLIYVDAKDAGAPPYLADLDPGPHTFEAKGARSISAVLPLKVDKGGSYEETLTLRAQAGTVVVTADVAGSEIAIDGKVVGHGAYEGAITAGTHQLEVSKAGYPKYTNALIVHDGDRAVVEVPLAGGAALLLASRPHDWKGVYAHLELVGQIEITRPTNDVAQGIGYASGTSIGSANIYGGGLDVRVGYSFGFVGVEASALLAFDHSSFGVALAQGDATPAHPGPTPRTEDYEFERVGGTAVLGVRLMPKTRVVRPTLGIGGGVSLKEVFYTRTIQSQAQGVTGTFTETTNPAFYPAPSLMIDGGVMLGSTPGTKLYLGCILVADFARATPVSPTVPDPNFSAPPGGLDGVNGTDVFIGPILGMQLGE